MFQVAASLALLVPAAPYLGWGLPHAAGPGAQDLATIAKEVADDGQVWIGVGLGTAPGGGIEVAWVAPGSPAERAGLAEGDLLHAADELPLADPQALIALMEGKAPGDALILDVRRGDRAMTFLARLTERPSEPAPEFPVPAAPSQGPGAEKQGSGSDVGAQFRPRERAALGRLVEIDREGGLSFQDAWPEINWIGSSRETFLGVSLSDSERGTRIESIEPGSAAEQAGLQAGDLVVEFDRSKILDSGGLVERVRAQEPGDLVEVVIERDGKTLNLEATLGMRAPADPALAPQELSLRGGPGILEMPRGGDGRFFWNGIELDPDSLGPFDSQDFEQDMSEWAELLERQFDGWSERLEEKMEEFSEEFEDWSHELESAFESDMKLFAGELPGLFSESETVQKMLEGASRGRAFQQRVFTGPEGIRVFRVEGEQGADGGWNWREQVTEESPQKQSKARLEGSASQAGTLEALTERLGALESELASLRAENAELRRQLEDR